MDNHADIGFDQSSFVTCPTCRTRYNPVPSAGTTAPRYRCARCDAVFVASEGRAAYRVASPGASRGARPTAVLVGPQNRRGSGQMAIGMDDPSLADRVRTTALDDMATGEDRAVWTYRVASEIVTEESAEAPTDGIPDPDDDDGLLAETLAEAEQVAPRGRPAVGGLVVACGLGLTGWAAGRYVAEPIAGDRMIWSSVGAMLGLFIGWMTIRWMARNP